MRGQLVSVAVIALVAASVALVEVGGPAAAVTAPVVQPGENLALRPGVTATQWPETTESSVRPASRAIDGNTNGNYNLGSVSHTGTSAVPPENPYLEIDLGASYPIDRIAVWNRTDCCADRLREFAVVVSDRPVGGPVTNFNLMVDGVWHATVMVTPNPSVNVPVRATGRYVRIHQRRNTVLHLAEVQVFSPGLPAAGLPAEVSPSGLSNRSEPLPFSVTDIATTGEQFLSAELAEVWALANVGDTMFVGGRFLNVLENATGRKVPQAYLAAFRASTGEFLEGWRPTFSGGVSELLALPDGRLLVVGAFRSVNGTTTNQGVVILDPATGAIDPSFRVRVAGGGAQVLDADVQGGWVYLGGGFTTVSGGPGAGSTVTGYTSVARVRLADGAPDPVWKPSLSGTNRTVAGLDAAPSGDRVYIAGFFTAVSGDSGSGYLAWLDTVTGNRIPGLPAHRPSTTERHQWDVIESGPSVYEIGTQHEAQATNRSTKADGRIHLTRRLPNQSSQGGDMQTAVVVDGTIYVTCHCLHSTLFWNVSNAQWSAANQNPNTPRQPATGIWRADATSFTPDPVFSPEIWYSSGVKGSGQGMWAVDGDDAGCIWAGGDVREVRQRTSGRRVAQRGFTKLCPVDDVAPPTPPNAAARWVDGSTVALSWGAVVDDRPGRTYEVLRNGVPLARVTTTSYTDPTATAGDVYAVRAADRRGNRSASSVALAVGSPPASVIARLAPGSVWRYSLAEPPAEWTTPGFDDSGWPAGPAQLGWGDGDEATVIPGKPVATNLRRVLEVPPGATPTSVEIRYLRDDGLAVEVNGAEVVRDNLPDGPLGPTTLATEFIFGAAENAWTTVEVPASLLVPGPNVVTARLHQTTVGNGDGSFDLEVVVRGA